DGAAAVGTDHWTENLKYEVGESVDDAWLLVKPRRRVDHAEHPRPCRYAIQIAKSTPEASQDRKRRHPRGGVPLLHRQFASYLAQGRRKCAIRTLRPVTGDERPMAYDMDKLKRQHYTRRRPCRRRQDQP